MAFNSDKYDVEKVLAQVVESTWACDRTWVQVLCMPFMCYLNYNYFNYVIVLYNILVLGSDITFLND